MSVSCGVKLGRYMSLPAAISVAIWGFLFIELHFRWFPFDSPCPLEPILC